MAPFLDRQSQTVTTQNICDVTKSKQHSNESFATGTQFLHTFCSDNFSIITCPYGDRGACHNHSWQRWVWSIHNIFILLKIFRWQAEETLRELNLQFLIKSFIYEVKFVLGSTIKLSTTLCNVCRRNLFQFNEFFHSLWTISAVF